MGHFFFFLSGHVCYFKGRSLRCSPGRGNAGCCAVTLYVGEGPSGSNGARLTLLRISVTTSTTHNQIGPLWCWFPSGWACAHSRPLWVSPTTSPVRLGVSPVAAPTPTGVFSEVRGFISLGWSPGLHSMFRSPAGPPGWGCGVCYRSHCLPRSSHNPPRLWIWPCCQEPVCPCCRSPPLLPVWTNVSSLSLWLLDFRAVGFSVSSRCFLFLNCCPSFGYARRRSVSTYASILAFPISSS